MVIRVGLDLDGSLESLGNSMTDLADALVRTGDVELVRFRSRTSSSSGETPLSMRGLWSPLWRRSRGRSIDGLLSEVDVIHVAGHATPPTGSIPLIISVDDLRPLRGEARTHLRTTQLKRAVERGAILVASTRSASHEVIAVLGVQRSRVVVVPPAVPVVERTIHGHQLVVNITGGDDLFLAIAPELIRYCDANASRVVALASSEVSQRIHSTGLSVDVRPRGRRVRPWVTLAWSCICQTAHDFPHSRLRRCRQESRPSREQLRSIANCWQARPLSPRTIRSSWKHWVRRGPMNRAGQSWLPPDDREQQTSPPIRRPGPTFLSITTSCEAGLREEDDRHLGGTALSTPTGRNRDVRSWTDRRSRGAE